ncbi:MAG: flagellar filament capping protein FliD [Pseudomonadota bacterium]
MGLITTSGIGSGIDVDSIIGALVAFQRDNKVEQFTFEKAFAEATLSGLGSLRSALSELRSSIFDLSSESAFQARTTSSSDTEVANIAAEITATPGNFTLTIDQVALNSKAESGIFTSADDTVGSGRLTIAAGENTFSVDVSSTDTLANIQDNINSAAENFGVTANLINGDNGTIIVFSSTESGTGNDITITNDDASLDSLSTVANAGGAGGVTITQNALDAQITIDGQQVSSATNTFTNAIQDTTITINPDATIGDTSNLTISLDKDAVRTNIAQFVTVYNAFLNVADQLQRPDLDATGILQGDSTLRSLMSQFRRDFSNVVESIDSDFNSLASLGIASTKEGPLQIDTLELDDAIENNFDEISQIFTAEDGIASRFLDRIDQYTGTGGLIDTREETLENQIERVIKAEEDLFFRLNKMEENLRRRFTTMDILVAQSNNTLDFIQQQFATLNNVNDN